MNDTTLSLNEARRLALAGQRLDSSDATFDGKETIAQTIETLGYVQIDTISVVAHAHHNALWVRHPKYRPQMLHELQAEDRRIYEYWGHAASYLPMGDFRFTLPQKERHRQPPTSKWAVERMDRCGHMLEPVLQRIRAEGPLRSQDFEPPPGTQRGTWWDWKPAKIALELLFWRGELMISERRGFQRVYDLTERVLPEDVDTRMPTDEELGQFLVQRALLAHGFAPASEIRDHLRAADKRVIDAALTDMIESGKVVPVQVEGIDEVSYFALTTSIDRIDRPASDPEVSLLSPFDNAIIQRKRLEQLYDFHYTLECYVPEPKRIYGYFVFSILWGDRLVGRFDPKADRKERVLYVRRLLFEPWFDISDDFMAAFAGKLKAFAAFNECDRVVVEDVRTQGVVRRLRKELK